MGTQLLEPAGVGPHFDGVRAKKKSALAKSSVRALAQLLACHQDMIVLPTLVSTLFLRRRLAVAAAAVFAAGAVAAFVLDEPSSPMGLRLGRVLAGALALCGLAAVAWGAALTSPARS